MFSDDCHSVSEPILLLLLLSLVAVPVWLHDIVFWLRILFTLNNRTSFRVHSRDMVSVMKLLALHPALAVHLRSFSFSAVWFCLLFFFYCFFFFSFFFFFLFFLFIFFVKLFCWTNYVLFDVNDRDEEVEKQLDNLILSLLLCFDSKQLSLSLSLINFSCFHFSLFFFTDSYFTFVFVCVHHIRRGYSSPWQPLLVPHPHPHTHTFQTPFFPTF